MTNNQSCSDRFDCISLFLRKKKRKIDPKGNKRQRYLRKSCNAVLSRLSNNSSKQKQCYSTRECWFLQRAVHAHLVYNSLDLVCLGYLQENYGYARRINERVKVSMMIVNTSNVRVHHRVLSKSLLRKI